MPDQVLFVFIEGLAMEMEAWELIRLFFDADSIRFIENGLDAPNPSLRVNAAELGKGPLNASLLVVRTQEDEAGWTCSVSFFADIDNVRALHEGLALQRKPHCFHTRTISRAETEKPGGRLSGNHKILAGACIYELLSQYTGKKLPYGSLTGIRPVKLAMQCLEDGMDKSISLKHLMSATGMSAQKAELIWNVAQVEYPLIREQPKRYHLYVGIPFCLSRCLYCSFTSYPVKGFEHLIADYMDALEKEAAVISQWVREGEMKLGTVYIGGGTPTALDERHFRILLDFLTRYFPIHGNEFTVEAGRPDSITREKLKTMKKYGVSRISINPQTMNDKTLRLIGRNHTSEDIEEKFALAREMGFDHINMDVIAGLPGEDEAMFRTTLDRIEAMRPEGLTVHTMSIKRASRLREAKDAFTAAKDEVVEAMINEAAQSARKMGMRPYYLYRQKNILANLENTGYALPGRECQYNIQTMEERQTILALGAGAISKFVLPGGRIERHFNLKEVGLYIKRIDEMIEKKKQYFAGQVT